MVSWLNHTNASLVFCSHNSTFDVQCGVCVASEPWLEFSTALNAWFFINVPLWLVGTSLDLLLCLSIFSDRKLLKNKASGMVLVGNLIVVETLMTSLFMAIYVVMNWTGGRHRDANLGCGVVHFAFVWLIVTSHYSTLFVAASRLMATMAPVTFRKYGSMRANAGAIVSAWVIGFACTMPYAFGVGSYNGRVAPWYACGGIVVSGFKYTIIIGVSNYLPVVLSAAAYVVLFFRTHASVSNAPGIGRKERGANSTSTQRRLLSVKMLAIASLVSWIGYFVQPTVVSAAPCLALRYPIVRLWLITLFFGGYIFNPVRRMSELSC